MKKLLIIILGLFLLSCAEQKENKKYHMEVYVKVVYSDNAKDTLKVDYTFYDDSLARPYLVLNDKGCLQSGFDGFFTRSKNNVACEVKTFEKLYGVVNGKDTIR